jgi:hypothetical protein
VIVRGRVWVGFVVVSALACGLSAAATADTISAICRSANASQTCDSAVWYTSPVSVTWQADPPPDSTSGCELGIAPKVPPYYFNTDMVTPISCTATWSGPNGSIGISPQYIIHLETSNPTASAAPIRPPDHNGWYNHPVIVSFIGAAFSGIRACTLPITYAGPDTLSTTASGSCTDNAGKTVVATSAPFAYDATPPSLDITVNTGDGVVDLRWATMDIAPMESLQIVRSPGRRGTPSSVVYNGDETAFRDTGVTNSIHYGYTLTAQDQAGNQTVRDVFVAPGPRLLTPVQDAPVNAPPLLSWTPVRRASYYNVQLYRGNTKLLSAWPDEAMLQLKPLWKFGGRRHRLKPGRYRWYVWPGFGRRAEARYGHLIGTSTFVVA